MSIQYNQTDMTDKTDMEVVAKRILKSRWNILLIAFVVRYIIIICGVITFFADSIGIHIGGFLFRLIPQPNNITINTTEYENRINDCLGGWSTGVELLTFCSVVFIMMIKNIVMRLIGETEDSD
jgi:hypothetical protein